MKIVFLCLAVVLISSCSKRNDGYSDPIIHYDKENRDTLRGDPSFINDDFYSMIKERNEIINEKAKKKGDILIELHFPDDIYFSPDNKYILYVTFYDAYSGDHFMYMGKIQKHIYLKNYPCDGNIECPRIEIMDFNDSICYWWSPSKDDNPFRFHGNKITVYLNSHSSFPESIQDMMSNEEQAIMNMQPDFIEELRSNTWILYKDYMDSINRANHSSELLFQSQATD